MASAVRAGPPVVLLRAMASTSTQHHRASAVTWRGGSGRVGGVRGGLLGRAAACPSAPAAARPHWASRLAHAAPRRNPAAFRLFAGGADGPAGPTAEDDDTGDGSASLGSGTMTRDWMSELNWIPPLDPTKETEEIDPEVEPQTMVLPLFPLGSTAYMPHSDHILNIFEPRYRQMYSDILFNGSRRFAVPVSHPETGRLASVAPVFYLEDLKEVSEQTQDAVKYVCSHKVIGRVRIKRTLNDKVWADRSTYLKAVVEPLEDGDDDEDLSTREGHLTERFASIIENQTKLQEPVRFTENLIDTLSAARGEDGLWRLAGLWQSLLQNRLSAKENELSNDIQALLRSYLDKQGNDMQSKVTVQFDSLPADIRAEFTRLQQTYREESLAMVMATLYPFVLLVQCETHGERLNVFGEMMEEEEKRLQAKVALQSLFSGGGKEEGRGGGEEGWDEPPLTA